MNDLLKAEFDHIMPLTASGIESVAFCLLHLGSFFTFSFPWYGAISVLRFYHQETFLKMDTRQPSSFEDLVRLVTQT
jgi:hypothetical protein